MTSVRNNVTILPCAGITKEKQLSFQVNLKLSKP